MNFLSLRNSALRLGTIVGLLGGLALVVTVLRFRGPTIYVPYSVLVLALTTISWFSHPRERWQRFGLVLTGFMVASLTLYLYIILIDNPSALSIPILGHAWRLGLLVTIGAALAGAASFFTERPSRQVKHG